MVIRLSSSAFDGVTSLLTHLYTECRLDKHKVSKDLWAKLKVYKEGIRRAAGTPQQERRRIWA